MNTKKCNDSDNGIDIYLNGTVYGKNPSTGIWESKSDYCLTSIKLVKYFCNEIVLGYYSNTYNANITDCPNGYRFGACLR